ADGPAALTRAVREWMASAAVAQNQVVLRTPPSGAQPLALAVDRAQLDGILGTVAGDDTVLVITANAKTANELLARLDTIANGRRA
ncbi:MAG: arginine repressor, partial [Planctomycetota bacterium]